MEQFFFKCYKKAKEALPFFSLAKKRTSEEISFEKILYNNSKSVSSRAIVLGLILSQTDGGC